MRKLIQGKKDRGANLIEFALVLPLLLLLVLGIIEFAWVFATNLDVKHGAREGARITAVSEPAPGDRAALGAEVCSRMNLAGVPGTTVTWVSDDGSPDVGEGVTVTVSTNSLTTLTGFLDWAFAGVSSLDSSVEIRIEQTPGWTDGSYSCT